jgi:hypothetical protein
MGSGLSTKRVAFVRAEMENNRLEVQGIFSESRARWDKDDHAFQQLHWAADVLQCVVRSHFLQRELQYKIEVRNYEVRPPPPANRQPLSAHSHSHRQHVNPRVPARHMHPIVDASRWAAASKGVE